MSSPNIQERARLNRLWRARLNTYRRTRHPIPDTPHLNYVPQDILDYIVYPMIQAPDTSTERYALMRDIENRRIQQILNTIDSEMSTDIEYHTCAMNHLGNPDFDIDTPPVPHTHIAVKVPMRQLADAYDIVSEFIEPTDPFDPNNIQMVYHFFFGEDNSEIVLIGIPDYMSRHFQAMR